MGYVAILMVTAPMTEQLATSAMEVIISLTSVNTCVCQDLLVADRLVFLYPYNVPSENQNILHTELYWKFKNFL